MLALLLIFVLMFVALAALFAGGTLSVQSNIYSQPTTGILWKAPAAAAALTAFYGIWVVIDYRVLDPNSSETVMPFDTIFRFSPKEIRDVDQFVSITKGKPTTYKREQVGAAGPRYVSTNSNKVWTRSDTNGAVEEIVIEEKGKKASFKAKMTKEGNFKPGEEFPGYYEVDGRRKMEQLGQVTTFRWGLYIGNLILNGLNLIVWFVCLWLLLRFQWMHALFLAALLWLLATLWIVPMLLEKTRHVAQERAGVPLTWVVPVEKTVVVVPGQG